MSKPLALIVEDDPKLNEIISIALDADFELAACTDGSIALERFKETIPQIIVLDLNLPGLPGKDILAYVRAEERLAKTRVILATADERQAETLTNSADIVLLKPVSPGLLKELALRMMRDASPHT